MDDDQAKFPPLPDAIRETSPLVIMIVGISIPVALIAWAATSESTPVLILAVIAMLGVATVTMSFMMRIMDDGPESSQGEDARAEPPH